ncbi:hypothetical protein K3758_05405 [Sulfitobacter sp. W002]|uniref:hypothetical protein n=1 Tax=Sulfitobacter sp. W002 TaxID=2867024 RepID=UPI0021A4E9D5|nr:hypothetical protein [Sulfitobacter sp. W002]UWR30966.1 hypothetical protein K3758_05405 [Sulfitobacter sp. W002]
MIFAILNAIGGRAMAWLLVLAVGAGATFWTTNLWGRMQDAKIQIETLEAERDAARQAADDVAKRAEQALEAAKRAAEALQGRLERLSQAPRDEWLEKPLPPEFWE